MFDPKTRKRIPAGMLFAISALIGAICFLGVYGHRVLDFTNTGWLFDNSHDLRQHYIAWCRYRSDPWHFPIGLIDSLSYPHSMSVIYTDSIPLFAVIFKLMSVYLPQDFQYFGLFGIMSFALMGGFASILLRRFTDIDGVCIAGSVFYVLSAPVIQRMYYHTALGAQFIITASLVLWVYDDLIGSDRRRMVYWGLMGFLCVAIHSYFLPMAGMILAALAVIQIKKKKAALAAGEFAAFSAAGLANLYVLGAFYGGTDASGPGLGTFNSNLNTFVNPWEIGRLLPALPLENDFQYEGMAYLGAGILLLFAVVAAGIVIRRIRKVPEEAFFSDRIYGRVTVLLTAVSFAAAVLPNISFGKLRILWIPYPHFVERLLGIFRSNGRLVWTAMYILMTAAISFTAYTFRRYRGVAVMIVAAALALQITDMSRTFSGKYELYMSDHPTDTVWDDEEVSEFIKGKSEFIFLYTDNDITMQTAYYGYFHGMRQNNYYYARDIEDKVADTIRLYYSELDEGNIRDDAVYIIKSEDYNKDSRYYDSMDCERMERFGHVIFKAQKKDHGKP